MSSTFQPYQTLEPYLAAYYQATDPTLKEFIWGAWDVLEPGKELQWSWHIDAMCDHLEAVTDGRIEKLMINVPPRCMKSLIVSVFWPAWLWIKHPELRFLISSSDDDLVVDLSLKRRDLIQSQWYQSQWGDRFKLAGDQNVKKKFRNNRKGVMQGVAISAKVTGRGADIIIVDDPHDVKDADSPAKIEQAKRGYKALSSRKNNPKKPKTVIIGQRVREDDLCGDLLKNDPGWDLVCIPMLYELDEARKRKPTAIGWVDPREREGQLLWPDRYDDKAIGQIKADLGSYGFAAQQQQRPSPAGGGILQSKWFRYIDAKDLPRGLRRVRAWDFAATEPKVGNSDPDYTAGVLQGTDDATGNFYIIDVQREQLSPAGVEALVKRIAQRDGQSTTVVIEEEKGATGKHTVDYYQRKVLSGFIVKPGVLFGDKVTRARAFAAAAEAGRVYLVRGEWNYEYCAEGDKFPYGAHKDQIDGSSSGFNELNSENFGINLGQVKASGNNYERPVF